MRIFPLAALASLLLAAAPAHADPIITPTLIAIGVSASVAPFLSAGITIAISLGLSLISSTLFAPAQPKPSDGQTIIRQSSAARFRSYGRVKVGGVLMFANSSFGVLDRVIAMGSGEIDEVEGHWIDDQLVTVDGSGNVGGKYSGHCVLEYRLGTDSPVVYSSLQTAYPTLWTSDHLGKGIPSAHMQMFQVPSSQLTDIWPNLANTMYRQVQRGAKIRGVFGGALSAPTFSDNAALVILDYLTHPDGLNLSDSWIENEIDSWAAAQLVCEEAVALAAGGAEARYRIWNTYRFDERPADVLARYMQACDAAIFPTPNRGLAIKVGKWELPTVTIDDDAIVAFSEVGRGRDVLTTANLVRARFMSPDHDYQETDAEAWTDDDDIAARGEFPIDLDLFSVPSHPQCRRLMKIAAYRANPNWVGTLVCNLRALPAMGERFVTVQCSELGIDETFEILNMQFLIEGTILKGVQLQVQSLSSDAYDWDPAEEEGTGPSVPDPITGDNTIPVPTGFEISSTFGPYITLAWDAPPFDFLIIQIQYRRTTDSDWTFAFLPPEGATEGTVGPLTDATEYEFQIRHYSPSTNRTSNWSSSITGTTATVDFDFEGSRYYNSGNVGDISAALTVTRASEAYADNLAGTWTKFLSNVARLTDKGLLVEESRTNSIRNNSMQGAAAGSPGTLPTNWSVTLPTGLTRTITTGTTDGVEWIEINWAGTTTSTNQFLFYMEAQTAIAAVNGDRWAGSVFVSNPASTGITSLAFNFRLNDGAGAALGNQDIVTGLKDAAWARVGANVQTNNASLGFIVPRFSTNSITNGTVVNFTIRIGWPQGEKVTDANNTYTSPIRTTSAAVTRSADVIALTSSPTFGLKYSLFAKATPRAPSALSAAQVMVEINDGTANNRWSLRRATGAAVAVLTAGGAGLNLSTGTWAQNTSGKIAGAYQSGDRSLVFDGGTPAPGNSANQPTGILQTYIGATAAGTGQANGWIERITVWPTARIPDTEEQRLTA